MRSATRETGRKKMKAALAEIEKANAYLMHLPDKNKPEFEMKEIAILLSRSIQAASLKMYSPEEIIACIKRSGLHVSKSFEQHCKKMIREIGETVQTSEETSGHSLDHEPVSAAFSDVTESQKEYVSKSVEHLKTDIHDSFKELEKHNSAAAVAAPLKEAEARVQSAVNETVGESKSVLSSGSSNDIGKSSEISVTPSVFRPSSSGFQIKPDTVDI